MKPKQVLDNFRGDPCEPLRKVIWDALTEATTGRHVDRAIRAAHVLESGLKEHGWPEGEE